jgi:alkylation response protein AidB-like acyl-CoA dehydrogenase
MNLQLTEQQRRFRAEVRAWLHDNVPKEQRPLEDTPAVREYDMTWQRRQHEGGWAGIAWPQEYGGKGLGLTEQMIWYEEYAHARAPSMQAVYFVGVNHAGPTLMACGTEAQKSFHLPRILRGESVWCQGFSEPGAGSDLASLRTRGVIDGDHLVVSGQKIWTSYAQYADYQELLVRTDPKSQRNRGLTWIICDMHAPGIRVRPIRLMSGAYDFCEVFYDEVRIPLANVVGEINNGWSVAMSTLAFERGTGFMSDQVKAGDTVDELFALARARNLLDDTEIARGLARLRAQIKALRALTLAAISRAEQSGRPGPEGSMLKLQVADLYQAIARVSLEILEDEATAWSYERRGWMREYLQSYAWSIGGGTSEIQREIIAERGLGLPRSR